MGDEPAIDEDWEEWDRAKDAFWVHAAAGSAAGVMEHTLIFPVDTFKVRLGGTEAPLRGLVRHPNTWPRTWPRLCVRIARMCCWRHLRATSGTWARRGLLSSLGAALCTDDDASQSWS